MHGINMIKMLKKHKNEMTIYSKDKLFSLFFYDNFHHLH